MGWFNGPPSWAEMERVLDGKPRHAGRAHFPACIRRTTSPFRASAGHTSSRTSRAGRVRRSSVSYAELHAHSAYSFLDGASTPEELVEEAARLDLRALALTDHNGLYGAVRFAEAAAELDVRTVFGAELSLGGSSRTEQPDPPGPHLLVLARGPEGYRRLSRQLAAAHLAGGEKGKLRYDYRRADRGGRRTLAHPDRMPQRACAPSAFRRRPGGGASGRWPIWWTGSARSGSASS